MGWSPDSDAEKMLYNRRLDSQVCLEVTQYSTKIPILTCVSQFPASVKT